MPPFFIALFVALLTFLFTFLLLSLINGFPNDLYPMQGH